MAGISSEAAKGTDYAENKKGFNGNELQSKEFSDLSGLAWYDFNARTYDPQTGRFIQIDPTPEDGDQERLTPYHFTGNNPIRYDDPNGQCGWCDRVKDAIVETAENVGAGVLGAVNAYTSDNVGGIGLSDCSNLSGNSGEAFRDGQHVGHIAAIVTGALEGLGAGVGAVFSGGASAPVSIPLAIHGTATTAIAIRNIATSNNPYGSKGKPDHQQKVDEVNRQAQKEAKPGETVLRERKIQGHDSRRKPDSQIVDRNGKTRKVFEAERKPQSQRNIKREKEYKKLNVDQETYKVGS